MRQSGGGSSGGSLHGILLLGLRLRLRLQPPVLDSLGLGNEHTAKFHNLRLSRQVLSRVGRCGFDCGPHGVEASLVLGPFIGREEVDGA